MRLSENPLKSRADFADALLTMCRPLKQYYGKCCSTLHLGSTAAHYGTKSADMEGWARVLWRLAPLFAGDNSTLPIEMQREICGWKQLYRTGLINGTDPESIGYWGNVYDYDQKMVEQTAIAVALLLTPDTLWFPLTELQRKNLTVWLNQINYRKVYSNNWRFFRILTNLALLKLGMYPNKNRLKEDFEVIEKCYKGDGWYYDGNDGQIDYYIPFAMHFYSLLWSIFAPHTTAESEKYILKLRQRSARFTQDYIHWFSRDGIEVPFGRSLTYRFAHVAFFSALALAGEAPISPGCMHYLVRTNLQHWFSLPIFDNGNILSIGYRYPNLIMSEKYNAPGSPYWSFKVFLLLALPESHPFWHEEEKKLSHPTQSAQHQPRMLVCHDEDHVMLFPVGQHCAEHGNCAAKYEKFVYSNQFGLSVSRGNTLEMGAFDSSLAISRAGKDDYHVCYGVRNYAFTADYTWRHYEIMSGVEIESWIVPCSTGWHVRIHKIINTIPVDLADGAFALAKEEPLGNINSKIDVQPTGRETRKIENGILVAAPWGMSGIFSDTTCDAKALYAAPNTNIMNPLTVIPTLTLRLEAGTHLLVHSVFGASSCHAAKKLKNCPKIKRESELIQIEQDSDFVLRINTSLPLK